MGKQKERALAAETRTSQGDITQSQRQRLSALKMVNTYARAVECNAKAEADIDRAYTELQMAVDCLQRAGALLKHGLGVSP